MYGSGVAAVIGLFIFLFGAISFIVWLVAISGFIKTAQRKGYQLDGSDCVSRGMMWAMGIFATPVVLALYVVALPDLNAKSAVQVASEPATIEDQLPEI